MAESLYINKGEKFKRGEFKLNTSTVSVDDNQAKVSLVSWMDSKAVHCLTELKTELMLVKHNRILDLTNSSMFQCRAFSKFTRSLWEAQI